MSPPHVVGIVGNDITTDSRVKKTAATMAEAGYRSSIVCYTPGMDRTSMMGDVEVHRVNVPFTLRDRHRLRQPLRPLVGAELAARHHPARQDRIARKRRLDAARGHERSSTATRAALKAQLWASLQTYRLRGRVHVTRDRVVRRALRLWSHGWSRIDRGIGRPPGQALDYELTFGPKLLELRPDAIHAHDMHMIGVALTSARLLRRQGHRTRVVYDAHELIEGLDYDHDVIEAWLREEADHIHDVDAVIGVSIEQVQRIQSRHGLDEAPTVVMNAPPTPETDVSGPTLRDLVPDGRILVYHGNLNEQRGVFDLVDALPHLADDVHAVFVAPANDPTVEKLRSRAAERRVRHRLHVVDFVPGEQLPGLLGTADIAVIPYRFTGNHDVALPNKLFEALQAGLPVLTSDMRALRRFQQDHGTGLVCAHSDPEDLASTATEMLDDLDRFRSRITPELLRHVSWDAQAERLVDIYDRLLDHRSPRPIHVRHPEVGQTGTPAAGDDSQPPCLAIGPRNMAGQAFLMARAIEDHLHVPAASFALDDGRFQFPADHVITPANWTDPAWQRDQIQLLCANFTHAITESGTGLFGAVNGGFVDEQLPLLSEAGIEAAVLLHGSEIRDPRRHRHRPYSPYATGAPLIDRLDTATTRLRRHLDGIGLPVFVTTPDLLQDVAATWLPVVIDTEAWAGLRPAFDHERPVVLHLPSNGLLKGTDYVDEVLSAMEAEGEIAYLRPTGATQPHEVATLIERSDVVVDGIVLGAYGVMSCQALAAGRLAVANIQDLGTLRSGCPIIDADPSNLGDALRNVLRDRAAWEPRIAEGRAYVRAHHDGAMTASILSEFLGVDHHD